MISPSSSGSPAFSFKASRQPMLWTATAYALGIIVGRYEWRPVLWWFVAVVAFLAAASYFTSRRSAFAWTLALSAFFLAGAVHIQLRANRDRLDTSILPYADRQELDVTAHIMRDGRVHQDESAEIRQSLDVEAEQIQTAAGEIVPVQYGHSGSTRCEEGSRIQSAWARAKPDFCSVMVASTFSAARTKGTNAAFPGPRSSAGSRARPSPP